ncbi:MAG: class I SAM-dependent methyltransferase [Verrucomicrobiota bacterium]|nr:class I SAM-dependent methyltransferase [Verrucomicrobiota bacterium]
MNELAKPITPAVGDSLFEHFDWLYILCRERFFRDDTQRIIDALWPAGRPNVGEKLVELGCGPGFYARRLAQIFPQLQVLGLDRSHRLLEYAREKATQDGLRNCVLEYANVLDVARASETFDQVVASRLFTVLPEAEEVVAETFRVLKSGGRAFIAEPRFRLWASLPLFAMRMFAGVSGVKCHEPVAARIFWPREFDELVRTQPWRSVRVWQAGRYQYALCEKG